jgi:group I intron endonuclease
MSKSCKGVIYCIVCLKTNKKYIGQTRQEFEKRLYQHEIDSRRRKNYFYNSIRKYGWENFIWGIIEECEVNLLNEREKYWIQYYKTHIYEYGYNTELGGTDGVNPNRCKEFTIMDPNGVIHKEKNLREFCRINNLQRWHINKILNRKLASYKGWKLPETQLIGLELMADSKSKNYSFKSPEGKIYIGKNIAKLCREHGLSKSLMSSLRAGKIKSHKGWTIFTPAVTPEVVEE